MIHCFDVLAHESSIHPNKVMNKLLLNGEGTLNHLTDQSPHQSKKMPVLACRIAISPVSQLGRSQNSLGSP